VIGRVWRGWTTSDNAARYERVLRTRVLPEIERLPGSGGAFVLRREVAGEIEFLTLTLFDSMDAVRRFAGDDVEAAVVAPEAREFLAHFDERVIHYEIVLEPR
jgi:heme-degrading monooxygenase HmoA